MGGTSGVGDGNVRGSGFESSSEGSVTSGNSNRAESESSVLREAPRWIASAPASPPTNASANANVVAGLDDDDDDNDEDETYTAAGGTSNCSRLPVYVGEGAPVVKRRNHTGAKD